MNTIQDLMNDRILKEIKELKEAQAKLQGDVAKIADLVRDGKYEKSYAKDK